MMTDKATAEQVTDAFGYTVEGFGASYDRGSDSWGIYTMPGIKPFATVQGFNRKRLDWIMSALRQSAAPRPEVSDDRVERVARSMRGAMTPVDYAEGVAFIDIEAGARAAIAALTPVEGEGSNSR